MSRGNSNDFTEYFDGDIEYTEWDNLRREKTIFNSFYFLPTSYTCPRGFCRSNMYQTWIDRTCRCIRRCSWSVGTRRDFSRSRKICWTYWNIFHKCRLQSLSWSQTAWNLLVLIPVLNSSHYYQVRNWWPSRGTNAARSRYNLRWWVVSTVNQGQVRQKATLSIYNVWLDSFSLSVYSLLYMSTKFTNRVNRFIIYRSMKI